MSSANSGDTQRWDGIIKPYSLKDVERLRGSVRIEYTLAKNGAERLWSLLKSEPQVMALGALTGNQAVQQVRAGLQAIYLSGWQVAADANLSEQMYPDQSLYPVNSVPVVIRRINNALLRADQIDHQEGGNGIHWMAPIIADAEAGFGGSLNVFELVKAMIEAGAAGIHLEDQLASEKKCGHLGGKVLIPTRQAINNLVAARLAADICDVSTVLVARTDANAAALLTNDIDLRDKTFLTGERTNEGFFRVRAGIDQAVARALSYAPFADVLWCETSEPNLEEAKQFAAAVREKYPTKLLAYNCSPSFNWRNKLDESTIASFHQNDGWLRRSHRELGALGYKFQFITLAGFHALNFSMFQLAHDYQERGLPAYADLQTAEFSAERFGYTATKHQREVGAGYFDDVAQVIAQGSSSTTALAGSTEQEQFH
jgi:isocitrate lyase